MHRDEQSNHEDLVDRSKRLFDAGVDGLDAATLARLRRARERALEELTPWAWLKTPRVWLPAAAAASLVVVLAPQLVERGTEAQNNFEAVAAQDLEILLSEQELEMLADFEFYEWLDLQDVDGSESETDGVG